MATLAKRVGEYTFNDFLILIKEHEKADLLDGVIYMASPESTDNNDLGVWLLKLMSEFTEQSDLGKVYFSRVAFRITEKQGPARVGRNSVLAYCAVWRSLPYCEISAPLFPLPARNVLHESIGITALDGPSREWKGKERLFFGFRGFLRLDRPKKAA